MKEKIIELIRNFCAIEENIDEKTKLSHLSLDSLTFISIIVNLEDEFQIEFDIDDLNMKNWEEVQNIIETVEEKCNEKEHYFGDKTF